MKENESMTPSQGIDEFRFTSSSISSKLVPDMALTSPARSIAARFASVILPEESVVVDDRSHLTPAQMVESKLIHRLKESSLPVSHLHVRGMVRNRFEA